MLRQKRTYMLKNQHMIARKWVYDASKISILCFIFEHVSVLNNEHTVFSNLSMFVSKLFWACNILNINTICLNFEKPFFFQCIHTKRHLFHLHRFSISAYRAPFSPDEGLCYVFSIQNNYCEFLTSDGGNLQT